MNLYSAEFKTYWRFDQDLLANLRFAPNTNQYPQSWTKRVRNWQRVVISVWFGGRDALTGKRLTTTAHLHHWKISNILRKRECSISYDLNTGRLPNLVPLSATSHGIVGNNPIYEQVFRDALINVLKGRPPKHWSTADKISFIRDKWRTAQRYMAFYT